MRILFVCLALAVSSPQAAIAAVDYTAISPTGEERRAKMSESKQRAIIERYVRTADECILRAVAKHPQAQAARDERQLMLHLVVESMRYCVDEMRGMIDVLDEIHDPGAGKAFFMGPYLDVAPDKVQDYLNRVIPP